MACLYCGKDIGPFRILRDDEFCSDTHRKRYVERLGKALNLMGAPEPPPAGVAGFRDSLVVRDGAAAPVIHSPIRSHNVPPRTGNSWPLRIPPALGGEFRDWDCRASAILVTPRCAVRFRPLAATAPPRFALRLGEDGELGRERPIETPPPPSDRYMPIPVPRFVASAAEPSVSPAAGTPADTRMPAAFALPGAALPRPERQAGLIPLGNTPAAPEPARLSADTRPAATGWPMRVPAIGTLAGEADELDALRALSPCPEAMAGPRGQAAARAVEPASVVQWCAAPAAPHEPGFPLTVAETDVFEAIPAPALAERPAALPMAGCAAREVQPAARAVAVAGAGGSAMRRPGFAMTAAAPRGVAACQQARPVAPPEAAWRAVAPAHRAQVMAVAEDTLPRLSSLTLRVAENDVFEAVPPPAVCERHAPGAAPEPAARETHPAAAGAAAIVPGLRRPGMPELRLPAPAVESRQRLLPPPAATPAVLPVWPRAAAEVERKTMLEAPIAVPDLPSARPPAGGASESLPTAADPGTRPETAAEYETSPSLRLPEAAALRTAERLAGCRAVEPQPASRPIWSAGAADAPAALTPLAALPPAPEAATGYRILAAAAREFQPRAAAPAPSPLTNKAARFEPMTSIRVPAPSVEAVHGVPGLPETGFIPVEFYCQRAASTPVRRMQWANSRVPLTMPGFGFAVGAERSEDALPPKPAPKADVTEILSHPEAAKRRANRTIERIAQIAAAVVLGVSLWFAYRAVRLDHTIDSVNLAMGEAGTNPTTGAGAQGVRVPRTQQAQGTLDRVRSAIAGRAASEVTDTLHDGMTSWGAPARRFAAGWSHQAAGYTHVGDLELFRPSLNYRDYRLEFMGQVESKGMGWVVRAQDKQNYYAMKFKVVEAGLRPVIALVHYPVVGGRKGHSIETPLSVMVHRNTPLRVEVDVRGNRLTASVEGQRVESWTDDLLARGGVGFFSEAGERARLYWMKISRNQDWLGAVCAFLAGSGETQTAGAWRTGSPAGGRWPGLPPQEREAALAEAESSHRNIAIRGSAGRQDQGRIRWIC